MKQIIWEKLPWPIFGVCAFVSLFFGLWETEMKWFTDSPFITGLINGGCFVVFLIAAARSLRQYRTIFRFGIPGAVAGSSIGAFMKLSHDFGFVDAFTWCVLSTAALFFFALVLWGVFVRKPDAEIGS